ncbi:MAG TPA: DNA/RNA nuclease SfsA [Rhizobiales bacterium]|nr:DNA/RNA nuclease SfsA [Hyphomicrobiales bacterium]
MKFENPLVQGTLIKRYKRFLTDVKLADGSIITASCPNTGSMAGLLNPGNRVWLSVSDNPKRKYQHTWEMLECGDLADKPLVGINTHLPNKLVAAAVENDVIPELVGYSTLRREVKYGENSRIDLFLESKHKPPCYVEIKNVTFLRQPGLAEFPDTTTARGTKHLHELANMVSNGARAVMFYLVQRNDARRFSLADDVDPAYFNAYNEARAAGVETIAWSCKLDKTGIELDKPLPVDI